MISHLFGHQTRRLTCALSPGGRKGRSLGRENWDKGWVERGRWQASSWDDGWTESGRTRPKDRQRLTWLLVSDSPKMKLGLFSLNLSYCGILKAYSLQMSHCRCSKKGQNVTALGCGNGAWEERGRRGRIERWTDGWNWQKGKNVT